MITNVRKKDCIDGIHRHFRTSGKWILRHYHHNDQRQFMELYEKVFKQPISERELNWKYFQNPFGASIILVAESADLRICAVQVAMPFIKNVRGNEQVFYLGVDSMIDPEFRKTGLYGRMIYRLIAECHKNGGLFFGFPNAEAFPNIRKRFGNYPVKLTAQLKILRYHALLYKWARHKIKLRTPAPARTPLSFNSIAKHGTESRFRFLTFDDPRLATFYELALDKQLIFTKRTGDFLKWRYGEAPDRDYSALGAFEAADLISLIIFRVIIFGPFNAAVIIDIAELPGKQGLTPLIQYLASVLRLNKVDLICCLSHLDSKTGDILKGNRFISSKLNWYKRQFYLAISTDSFRVSNPDLAARLVDCIDDGTNWFVTLGDTDLL